MANTIVAGISGASVTSASEVDLLGQNGTPASVNGLALANSDRFTITVKTTQNIVLRVYVAAGPNAGLVVVPNWGTTVTSAAPYSLLVSGSSYGVIRVTAQASSTTASVSCDLRAVSP